MSSTPSSFPFIPSPLSPTPTAPLPKPVELIDHTAGRSKALPKLKFNGSDRFLRELRKRIDAYFEKTGRRRRDCPQMYFKTATILTVFATTYILLMFFATSWFTVIPLAILLGLGVAAIGFNVQHDAGHKAYSEHRWVNRTMAFTLDLMGGSSYMWDWKHNTIHHTYPNVAGYDDDINIGFLGRLSPQQPRHAFHRFQGVYLWFLYGFLAIKWHLVDDFHNLALGRIGEHKIPRPKGGDLVVFIAGKVIFFTMAFVLPMLLHKWYIALGVYALAAFVSGVVLSIVFQLAHVVGEADFPVPVVVSEHGVRMDTEWAIHQIQTTVDFSRGNPFLCWFLGGLNFQVEHHLFSRICHIHYPALSKVVEEACREFGVRYEANKSIFVAIRSHANWLTLMGQPAAV
jgi:linoleoyl-CoA desaturase